MQVWQPWPLTFGAACVAIAIGMSVGDDASFAGAPAPRPLPVVAVVDVASGFGDEQVILTGWLEIVQGEPRFEDGLEVVDLSIERLAWQGASRLGLIQAGERADDGGAYASGGEVRARQQGDLFPADVSLDLFLDVVAPSSPVGALALHNEVALHLSLEGPGGLPGWPPLGTGFVLDAESCLPLIETTGSQPNLGICVDGLTLDVAPVFALYSVGRDGPSALHPADLLALGPRSATSAQAQPPFVHLSCAGLGLSAAGCSREGGAVLDDIDALSFGNDLRGGDEGSTIRFSTGPGALGVAGSGVAGQHACPPGNPGFAPEPDADVFSSALTGNNMLLLDGNGPVGSCVSAFPLGLVEAATVRDNLDALVLEDGSAVDRDGDGIPESPVYFSLAAGSPSLAELGVGAADVLVTRKGEAPDVFASLGALGLGPDDELDGLCLAEDGDGLFSDADTLRFTLAPGSPTLDQIGAGPGDVLAPGVPPAIALASDRAGLRTGDDIDATDCSAPPGNGGGNGDVNCDGDTNSVDAALILQYHAALIGALPCAGGGDVDASGAIDDVDALLVLQFEARLLMHLPFVETINSPAVPAFPREEVHDGEEHGAE